MLAPKSARIAAPVAPLVTQPFWVVLANAMPCASPKTLNVLPLAVLAHSPRPARNAAAKGSLVPRTL